MTSSEPGHAQFVPTIPILVPLIRHLDDDDPNGKVSMDADAHRHLLIILSDNDPN